MNARDTAAILAGLRVLQGALPVLDTFESITTDGGTYPPLTDEYIDDLCERLNMPQAEATTHTIWVAAVDHRHGTNLYAAASKEDLDAQLASSCRQSWAELVPDPEPADDKSDRDVIEYYFNWQAEHGDEWHVIEDIDVEIANTTKGV